MQNENEATMKMLLCGSMKPTSKKSKYKKIDERLSHLKANLEGKQITLECYVDSVGYLLHLKL